MNSSFDHSLTLGPVDFGHFERITYYGASALTFSIAGIILSKVSFGLTLLRLTDGWLKVYVWFAIATLFLFAVPVAVLPWVLCKPITKTFVDILPGTCIDKNPSVRYGRFQAGSYAKLRRCETIAWLTYMVAWAAIMDISLALMPWKILWNLQMRFAEKIGVGIAMSLGILWVNLLLVSRIVLTGLKSRSHFCSPSEICRAAPNTGSILYGNWKSSNGSH
jgi:hypothetical protein